MCVQGGEELQRQLRDAKKQAKEAGKSAQSAAKKVRAQLPCSRGRTPAGLGAGALCAVRQRHAEEGRSFCCRAARALWQCTKLEAQVEDHAATVAELREELAERSAEEGAQEESANELQKQMREAAS